jgi:hypothetical protein
MVSNVRLVRRCQAWHVDLTKCHVDLTKTIEYRKARKFKSLRPQVLKEQAFYMPRERRDLAGTIIANKANWTNEEIMVWLDNEEKKEQGEYNRLESEFVRNGNRHTENGHKDIWGRLEKEHARDSERYIL